MSAHDVHAVETVVRDHLDLFFELVHHKAMRVESLFSEPEHHGHTHVKGDVLAAHGGARASGQVVLFYDEYVKAPFGKKGGRSQTSNAGSHHGNIVVILEQGVIQHLHGREPRNDSFC